MSDPFGHVYQTILACGIPGTLAAYPVGCVPPLPWFVYLMDGDGGLAADDCNYAEVPRFRVELYEKTRDAELESAVAEAIREAYGPVTVLPEWVSDEGVYMVAYSFAYTPRGTVTEDE